MKRHLILTTATAVSLLLVWGIITLPPRLAGQSALFEHDTIVVRAYYRDQAMLNEAARNNEPWEVNREQQYMVLEVTAGEYAQLEKAGFRPMIDEQLTAMLNTPRQPLPNQQDGIPGFPCYRTVTETFASAATLAAAYPDLAEWVDIGDSWEKLTPGGATGHDMLVLRLTNKANDLPKPKLFIVSAIHAREYTTAELASRFAEYLVSHYGLDADVTWLLDYHEIHLLLQANPDGRIQAESGLSWRKNTNADYCPIIPQWRGADLNRNFSFQWGCCGGSSINECSSTYRGLSPASEPETQAIQDYLRAEFADQRADDLNAAAPMTTTGIFLDIHSYSELLLWPWGFTTDGTANDTAIVTLGRKLAYFNNYSPEQAIDLYPTDGTTDDFAYGELGLAAYTFELGTQFFQACSDFENVIFPDNLPALIYAAKAVRDPYLAPAGPEVTNLALSSTVVTSGDIVTLTAILDDTRYNNSNGLEPVQAITAVAAYLDTPPWITATIPVSLPMTAVDGSFDSPVETAQLILDTTGLPEDRHTIFVRGRDADGNWGVFSAIFLPLGQRFYYFPVVMNGESQN